MPNEAEQDRSSFSAWGVKSSLHIPLVHAGRVAFIFACKSMHEEHAWPEEFLPRLRLLGDIFVNALVRTRAEEALRVSESRYRSLVETQSDLIARSDLSGRLTFVIHAYCRAFGRSREEPLGEVLTPTVLPEDLPISRGALDEIQLPRYREWLEHILQALELCHWRVKGPDGAAQLPGLKSSTLQSRMPWRPFKGRVINER